MLSGWYALHRELLSSDLWLGEPFTRGQAWVDLIGLARFKPGHARLNETRIDLDRGQLVWSQRRLAERWGWHRSKVQRFLRELQRDQRIDHRLVCATTVITLLNYDRYQSADPPARPPHDHPTNYQTGHQTGHQASHPTDTKEPCQQSQPRQPPSRAPVDQAPEPSTVGWEGVELALGKLGVAATRRAVQGAISAGRSIDAAEAIIEEYKSKPGAYGPGALVARLTGRLAAWPPPNEEFAKAEHHRAREQAYRAASQARDQRRRHAEAARQREAALEQQLGPVLDGLPAERLARLEHAAFADPAQLQLSRGCPVVHRLILLETLAAEVKLKAA